MKRADELHAVIGVCRDGDRTLYVQRSDLMANYPGVWSLLSIQFEPDEVDPLDLRAVQAVFERLAEERLGGVPLRVGHYLTSGTCNDNPMGQQVFLYLYQVSFGEEPRLNPRYYTSMDWLLPQEYKERTEGSACGLCLRLWSDYCFNHGLVDARFAPIPKGEVDD